MNKVSFIPIFIVLLAGIGCRQDEVRQTNAATTPVVIEHALLEAVELKALLDSGAQLVLIEVSKPDIYAKGHIANALNVWRTDYEDINSFPYTGMRASKAQMEALLSRLGILPTDTIVLYCRGGSADALRVYWLLHLYGHPHLQVLNGGFERWRQLALPIDTTVKELTRTDYHFSKTENTATLATLDEVLAAIGDTNVILLDTREAEEFMGMPYIDKDKVLPWKDGAFTFGRIPGAVHINWSEAVELDEDHRFKSLRALRWNFESRGIRPDKTIITYCQSGVRSAHTTFVLTKLLGYPNVKNYDGSWIEWSYYYTQYKNVPIARDLSEAEHARQLQALRANQRKAS